MNNTNDSGLLVSSELEGMVDPDQVFGTETNIPSEPEHQLLVMEFQKTLELKDGEIPIVLVGDRVKTLHWQNEFVLSFSARKAECRKLQAKWSGDIVLGSMFFSSLSELEEKKPKTFQKIIMTVMSIDETVDSDFSRVVLATAMDPLVHLRDWIK